MMLEQPNSPLEVYVKEFAALFDNIPFVILDSYRWTLDDKCFIEVFKFLDKLNEVVPKSDSPRRAIADKLLEPLEPFIKLMTEMKELQQKLDTEEQQSKRPKIFEDLKVLVTRFNNTRLWTKDFKGKDTTLRSLMRSLRCYLWTTRLSARSK